MWGPSPGSSSQVLATPLFSHPQRIQRWEQLAHPFLTCLDPALTQVNRPLAWLP
jgi:hypothetical protein